MIKIEEGAIGMNTKKVRKLLEKALALNTKEGTVCNVMFRGESSCFRTRLRAFLQKWVEEKGFCLVALNTSLKQM